jgi:GNAT superfamily N-acetyltransferase
MFTVRRLAADEGAVLRATRLAALADAPGDATTTVARSEAHDDDHWATSASANASGPLQATFFAEADGVDCPVGMVGAYANRDGVVNVVGLWAAPGHRDVGVATALLGALAGWARANGHVRLRLWVVERNEFARRFYEGEGFTGTGTSIAYELDPRISQCEMILDL